VLSQLIKQSRMRVPINNRFVFDIHCFTGIFKGIETLLIIRFSGANASNHICI